MKKRREQKKQEMGQLMEDVGISHADLSSRESRERGSWSQFLPRK